MKTKLLYTELEKLKHTLQTKEIFFNLIKPNEPEPTDEEVRFPDPALDD